MIGTVATAPNPIILVHTSHRISDAPGLSFDLFCSKYGLIIPSFARRATHLSVSGACPDPVSLWLVTLAASCQESVDGRPVFCILSKTSYFVDSAKKIS